LVRSRNAPARQADRVVFVSGTAAEWRKACADMSEVHERRIVVAVDGSEESKAALRWAAGQARLTGATVDAVTAWQPPKTQGYACTPFTDEQFASWAGEALSGCVEGTRDACRDVEVRQTVTHGDPATVLLRAADGAELLVMGTRGSRGRLARLLPQGSVSEQCAHHATCPIVLVGRGGHHPG
jgi:nucleotide-binding universal stress UspA family protein